jgi:hypothetical protein
LHHAQAFTSTNTKAFTWAHAQANASSHTETYSDHAEAYT